jgi:phosphoglycolate phosphatase
MSFNYQCVLFDLDGTLVDSRADIISSVQLTLAELDLPSLDATEIMHFVGEGARLLVERSLRASARRDPSELAIDKAFEILGKHYRLHLLDTTRPYPGVRSTLEAMAPIPKAVVTNKPFDFSVRLLEGLGLKQHFASIVGGDTLESRKPSPEPLLEALRQCQREPEECLMVGDSRLDIEAGREAGVTTCGFTSGFRGRRELEEAGATLMIDHFGELRRIVCGLE